MLNQPDEKLDVESRARPLLLVILESPELNWSFIQKVYSIVAIQFLATIAVAAFIFTVSPNSNFFPTTTTDFALCIVFIFVHFITLYYVYYYGQKYPVNYLLLGTFTHSTAFIIGLDVSCAVASEKVTLEAVILTVVVVIALTLYTFWATRRGQDFSFLDLFLFGSLLVLLVVRLIQIFFQVGKLSMMIYWCVATIIFCGNIVYDTDNLIKRFSYDEHIWASITLYLSIINLFLSLLTIFSVAD